MNQNHHFAGLTGFGRPAPGPVWRSGIALMGAALICCGCLSRPALNQQTFAFNTPFWPATNGPGHRVLGLRSLQIATPFAGRSLVYRTGEFSYQRDDYALFLTPPAEELVDPVCEWLRRSGCFSAIVGPGNLSAVKPDTLVAVSIRELYGDIRKPDNPSAVLALQVTFLDATNGLPGKVAFQRDYSRRIPLRSTAAAALMAGWNQALVEIFAAVAADFKSRDVASRAKEIRDDPPTAN